MEIKLIQIAMMLGFGMFIGAGIMFRIMYKENNSMEKELDIKSEALQIIKKDICEFAKFNCKHYDGCKNVYDKLKLYKSIHKRKW